MAATNTYPEVIDLVSSSDDDDEDVIPLPVQRNRRPIKAEPDADPQGADEEPLLPMAGAFPREAAAEPGPAHADPQERRIDGGTIFVVNGEEVFIPDEEPERAPSVDSAAATTGNGNDEDPLNNAAFTFDDCLVHVLEIFPDISHEHVRGLWDAFDAETSYETLGGRSRLDNIVEQLVSATSYPKEVKAKLKRKRVDSVDEAHDTKKWERADRAAVPAFAKGSIAAICKADFPMIPRNHIAERLATHNYLFQTYVALSKDVDDNKDGARVFGRGRAGNNTSADAETIALNCGHAELVAELAAARVQVAALRAQREADKAKKRAEEENLQRAIASGQTAECSACFDDLPMNRQIHCDGETTHFTCFDCAETYIKTEVGEARCRVSCPAGCGVGFSHSQLHLLENKQLLEKLAQIQQEQDIRDAGLEDLESCPFCEYKAIMPPVEEDFEFRCQNPECEKVSCRRCKAISHVPISCEQHAKDNKISSRHQIEEAMTAALIRSCVKCKNQFIKESGCNKMSCTSCGTMQCYVCSAVIKDYNHFDQGSHRGRTLNGGQPNNKCPLYDNVEERHEREVKAAEEKARAEVVESNPDVSPEDLEIKVSEAVKKAETARVQRAGEGYGGYAAGLGGFGAMYHARERLRWAYPDVDGGDLEELMGVFGGGRRLAARRGGEDAPGIAELRARAEGLGAAVAAQRQRQAHEGNPPNGAQNVGGAARVGDQGPGNRNPPNDIWNDPNHLQGYIPVVFPHERRQLAQMQERRQAQIAQMQANQQRPQPAAAAHNFDGWPDFFDGLFEAAPAPAAAAGAQEANPGGQNQVPGALDDFFAGPNYDNEALIAANNALRVPQYDVRVHADGRHAPVPPNNNNGGEVFYDNAVQNAAQRRYYQGPQPQQRLQMMLQQRQQQEAERQRQQQEAGQRRQQQMDPRLGAYRQQPDRLEERERQLRAQRDQMRNHAGPRARVGDRPRGADTYRPRRDN